MDNLIKQLEAFVPYNEQEERDLSVMLDLAKSGADVLTRKNKTAHFSASAWIVSPDRKSTLMCFHNIYNSWSWMGGHADGDADLKHVVVKEIGEECGLSPDKLHFLDDGIFSVEILTVNGHEKRGEYVPSHLHLNVTYLLETDPAFELQSKPDENKAVSWIRIADLSKRVSEQWMNERIYSKLVKKITAAD